MKWMQEIAVAQEEADHFRAAFEDAARLRIGAEPETVDGFQHAGARFPADLRAGIQYARDRPDTDPCRPGYLANRRFCWNRFHLLLAFPLPERPRFESLGD